MFWEGTAPARAVARDPRAWAAGWTRPASLGMGPMGGAPRAAALPSGAIEVVWRGSTVPHHIWSAVPGLRPAWPGPRDLGGQISGAPWPAAAQGTSAVLLPRHAASCGSYLRGRSGRWHRRPGWRWAGWPPRRSPRAVPAAARSRCSGRGRRVLCGPLRTPRPGQGRSGSAGASADRASRVARAGRAAAAGGPPPILTWPQAGARRAFRMRPDTGGRLVDPGSAG